MDEYNMSKDKRREKFSKQKHHPEKSSKRVNQELKGWINVYEDTLRVCEVERLWPERGDLPFLIQHDVVNVHIESPVSEKPNVTVKNCDTLEMTLDFRAFHLNPMVLILASDRCPGGGVASGKTAQEECVFRRTNLGLLMTEEIKKEWYPLEKGDSIYVPKVYIVKSSDFGLAKRQKDGTFDSFAAHFVSAIRKPRLVRQGDKESETAMLYEYAHTEDKDLMTAKVDGIFQTAITQGHDALVLGALGCGVFENPPEQVAEIFKSAIDRYGSYFKEIGFAILVVKPKDQLVFDAFQKCLNPQ